MPELKKFDDEIRVKVTKEFKKNLQAVADRRGESLSDFCRRILENGVNEDNANEGLDAVASTLRKVVRDQNRSFEDRFAAMLYKDTVISATGTYLICLMAEKMGYDLMGMYEEANKKAIAYANQPLRDRNRH